MITILTEPQELSPVFNEIITVLNSDNKTNNNFQFIVELYVNGKYQSRVKVPVNPRGYGVVDLHRHIEESINQSYDFDPTAVNFTKPLNGTATYSIVLKEEFRDTWTFEDNFILNGDVAFWSSTDEPFFSIGDEIFVDQDAGYVHSEYQGLSKISDIGYTASGDWGSAGWYIETDKGYSGSTPLNPGNINLANFELVTITSTASYTGTKWAIGGVLDWKDVPKWDYTKYTMGQDPPGKFLTNVPRENYKVSLDSRMWVNLYQDDDQDAYYLFIETDQGTYRIRNFYNDPKAGDRVLKVGVGPWNITNGTISVATGTLPVFGPNTKEYSFQILKADASSRSSEIMTFKIDDFCSRYEKLQLIFRDRLGSFIPYTFNMVSRKNINIDRKSFRQNYGSYDSGSGTWGYSNYDRGLKTLATSGTETYIVHSDWVDEETASFFRELFTSPEVYWLDEDGNATAIMITNNSYEEKKKVNDYVFNYTIEFQLANKNTYIR